MVDCRRGVDPLGGVSLMTWSWESILVFYFGCAAAVGVLAFFWGRYR
jgi:hypothetical protein